MIWLPNKDPVNRGLIALAIGCPVITCPSRANAEALSYADFIGSGVLTQKTADCVIEESTFRLSETAYSSTQRLLDTCGVPSSVVLTEDGARGADNNVGLH